MCSSPLFYTSMNSYYVSRGKKMFGPYEPKRLAELVKIGQLLKQDCVVEESPYGNQITDKKVSVGDVLKQHQIAVTPESEGSILEQARNIGSRIWFSRDIFKWSEIRKDSRLMLLGNIFLKFLAVFQPHSRYRLFSIQVSAARCQHHITDILF